MATKKAKFDKARRVKAVARKRVGSPKPARTLDERMLRSKPKYKEAWSEGVAE